MAVWELEAVILETKDTVVWKNFKNAVISSKDCTPFFCDYSNFPVFVFGKKQYSIEIEKLKSWLNNA